MDLMIVRFRSRRGLLSPSHLTLPGRCLWQLRKSIVGLKQIVGRVATTHIGPQVLGMQSQRPCSGAKALFLDLGVITTLVIFGTPNPGRSVVTFSRRPQPVLV